MTERNPFDALDDDVDEETARVSQMVEAAIRSSPPAITQDPIAFRDQSDNFNRRNAPRVAEAVDTTIAGLDARVFTPPTVTSVYLYIHGGAWMLGANDLADTMLWARAQRADTAVVSINYRLGPENKWPAALEDCEAAALWLAKHAVEEWGTDRLLIGGDSAGAHLSVATLLALRDRHGLTPFCGADLRYGMYDLRLTPGARQYPGAALSETELRWVLDHTFSPDQREDPLASPFLARLHDMPAALFTVGTNDSLLEDTLLMYARWRAAGSAAELVIYPGAMHAFDYMPVPAAAKSIDESVAFIQRVTQ
jgi:acetyl esterase/lipase